MTLQDYTTEELRAELRRRNEIIKAERANVMRCKQCKFYGKITYYVDILPPLKRVRFLDASV